MPGWVHIRGERTAYTNYYKKMKPEDAEQWPPKFWKFQLETDTQPKVEVAFTDARRFGRVRLVDCPGNDIRKASPLVENGPDPVVDVDIFTEDFFRTKLRSRHVPIKALLLDQAFLSGIGNWVGDEVLYQAKLHPEQYCDDFNDKQIKTLYDAVCFVCRTAVDKLGDSDQFPEDWLFNYRWGKGAKDSLARLPNGEKLAFVTVGGRTSCYAPGVQKKSGRIAPGVKEEPVVVKEEKPAKSGKAKSNQAAKPAPKRKRADDKVEPVEEKARPTKKPTQPSTTKPSPKANAKVVETGEAGNRRRSGRLNK